MKKTMKQLLFISLVVCCLFVGCKTEKMINFTVSYKGTTSNNYEAPTGSTWAEVASNLDLKILGNNYFVYGVHYLFADLNNDEPVKANELIEESKTYYYSENKEISFTVNGGTDYFYVPKNKTWADVTNIYSAFTKDSNNVYYNSILLKDSTSQNVTPSATVGAGNYTAQPD